MRAVLVNASESLVEHRRQLGIDKKDERWQGEWHFVNPPKQWHARLNTDLLLVLAPLARRVGLDPYTDNVGIFADPEQDWRVPDQAYARPEDIIDAGLRRAELVVEIYSHGDESRDKFAFYAGRMVAEVLIVHEDRRFELYRLSAKGDYEMVGDGSATSSSSEVLAVSFSAVPGPRLRVDWSDGFAEI